MTTFRSAVEARDVDAVTAMLADDVVFLAKGRVAEYGTAATFFDDPASGPARAYLAGRLVI